MEALPPTCSIISISKKTQLKLSSHSTKLYDQSDGDIEIIEKVKFVKGRQRNYMIDSKYITALRMERQHLNKPATEAEYNALYRDTSPGQNVYWCGFGDPPSLTFRADFNDMEYNRERQRNRTLVKGRFQGGNLGWIESSDMELFACMCRKPLDRPTESQQTLMDVIEREGPLNIQSMKEMTGMLVKEITPILHRLQEAFLIYEDQFDGAWDRGWYQFAEMFPDVNFRRYTKIEALKIVLKRFAYRNVLFNVDMAKSFYKMPVKDVKTAVAELLCEGEIMEIEGGYLLKTDYNLLQNTVVEFQKNIFVLHRNDFLVKSHEYDLKEKYKHHEYDILQYILIDGEFHGAVLGHFKNGPYIIEDVVLDSGIKNEKEEIIDAVYRVNNRKKSPVKRYMGREEMPL